MDQKVNWYTIILYIVAWLACSVFAVIVIMSIREASLDVMTAIQANQMESSAEKEKIKTQIDIGFMIRAVDQGMLFVGGVVFMILAIGMEVYFRKGMHQGIRTLLKRVALIAGLEIAIYVVSVVVRTFV